MDHDGLLAMELLPWTDHHGDHDHDHTITWWVMNARWWTAWIECVNWVIYFLGTVYIYIYINTLYLVLYFAFSSSKVKYLPLKNLLKRYFVLKLIKKSINKLLGEETNLSSKLLYYVTTCKNHKWSREHLS